MNDFKLNPEIEGMEQDKMLQMVPYHKILFMADFFYRIYSGDITIDELSVVQALSVNLFTESVIANLSPRRKPIKEFNEFDNAVICLNIIFKNERFAINLKRQIEQRGPSDYVYVNLIYIEKKSGSEITSKQLYDYLCKAVVDNSPLRNKSFRILDDQFVQNLFEFIEMKDSPNIMLDKLFMSDAVKFHINRFITEIQTERKKGNSKKGFRYLLSGPPGTGKTQLIGAILKAVDGQITIITIPGAQISLPEVINFCGHFEHCLLVIDDVDFYTRERRDTHHQGTLSYFLQALDGLFPQKLFILAATNDNKLVDEAASRPGRFDLIMDIGKISSEHYLKLIMRESENEEITSLFTHEILNFFEKKAVTGAFIVNLIKQLKSIKLIQENITHADLMNLINFMFDGFYKTNNPDELKQLGF